MVISFRRFCGILVPFVLLLLLVARSSLLAAVQTSVPVYLFWQEGCPYCAEAKAELKILSKAGPSIQLQEIEIGASAELDALFERTLAYFRYEQAAVLLDVIGGHTGRLHAGVGSQQFARRHLLRLPWSIHYGVHVGRCCDLCNGNAGVARRWPYWNLCQILAPGRWLCFAGDRRHSAVAAGVADLQLIEASGN